jgi:hypothetical protein
MYGPKTSWLHTLHTPSTGQDSRSLTPECSFKLGVASGKRNENEENRSFSLDFAPQAEA